MNAAKAVWQEREIPRDQKPTTFRQAYYITKTCLALAGKLGKPINQLTLAEFQSINQYIGPDVYDVFDLDKAMARRNIVGAPGTWQVALQLKRWKRPAGRSRGSFSWHVGVTFQFYLRTTGIRAYRVNDFQPGRFVWPDIFIYRHPSAVNHGATGGDEFPTNVEVFDAVI